jgi:prepilin-type N-terminal cleavage/methylation domain-containing protein
VPKFRESHKRIKQIERIQPIEQRLRSITLGISNFRHFQSGFTLFELLVAIVIFVLVLSTIYASATGTFRVVGETESRAEIYRMARIAMERMLEDLESVYVQEMPSGGSPASDTLAMPSFLGEDKEINGRSADSLRFTSRAHVNLGGQEKDPGAVEINYYVRESDRDEGLVLYRDERPIFQVLWSPEEDTGGLVLCEKLRSVDFSYHGKDDEIQDDWDSDSEEHKGVLPRMVTLSLEFNGGPDTNVPLRFMTRAALPAEQGSSW